PEHRCERVAHRAIVIDYRHVQDHLTVRPLMPLNGSFITGLLFLFGIALRIAWRNLAARRDCDLLQDLGFERRPFRARAAALESRSPQREPGRQTGREASSSSI